MKARDSKKKSRTDWDKLFSMADKDIDYSDIPALDEKFFKKGKLRIPKPSISIRVDPDVLA